MYSPPAEEEPSLLHSLSPTTPHGVIITGLYRRAQFDLFAGHRYDTR